MSEIRLLFAALPTMLGEIIRHAVQSEADLRIVEEKDALDDLSEAVARTRPDVLVVGVDDGILPRECARVMYELPFASTLTISQDGRVSSAYRLRPERILVESVSTGGIIEAIRELSLPPPELRE